MKLSKKRASIVTASVLALGVVAGTTTAFADSSANISKTAKSGTAAGKKAGAHENAKDHRQWGALLENGSHGSRTVKDKTGAWVTHEWQVGKVTAVSGSALTVVGADGTSWTWTTGSTTRVRAEAKKADPASVKTGDEVVVTGTQAGQANDAKLIVDPGTALIQKWEAAHDKAVANRAAHKKAKPAKPATGTAPSLTAPSTTG